MSNTARKARKKAYRQLVELDRQAGNIVDLKAFQFQHPVKVGTPLADRHVPMVTSNTRGQIHQHRSGNSIMRKFRRAKVTGEQVFLDPKVGA